jgi:hypothetical protein
MGMSCEACQDEAWGVKESLIEGRLGAQLIFPLRCWQCPLATEPGAGTDVVAIAASLAPVATFGTGDDVGTTLSTAHWL